MAAKDKALAAQRNGISVIIAPELNEPDTDEIPEHLRKKLTFHFVSHIDEVLETALEPVDGAPPPRQRRPRSVTREDRVYARDKQATRGE